MKKLLATRSESSCVGASRWSTAIPALWDGALSVARPSAKGYWALTEAGGSNPISSSRYEAAGRLVGTNDEQNRKASRESLESSNAKAG